jgi:hypothetical protein
MHGSAHRRGGYIEPYLVGRRPKRRSLRSRVARALTSPLVLVLLPLAAVLIIVLVR